MELSHLEVREGNTEVFFSIKNYVKFIFQERFLNCATILFFNIYAYQY